MRIGGEIVAGRYHRHTRRYDLTLHLADGRAHMMSVSSDSDLGRKLDKSWCEDDEWGLMSLQGMKLTLVKVPEKPATDTKREFSIESLRPYVNVDNMPDEAYEEWAESLIEDEEDDW